MRMDTSPKHLQDILKFAISQQHSTGHDIIQIDENKKKFLDCVLQTMSVNVMEEFYKAIRILQDDSSNVEEKCSALNLIREYIDNIDFANSFVKIEGADILINCVEQTNNSVRLDAITIIAEMSQNNPFCQQYFQKYRIVEKLIKYLYNDDQELVAIALYALSALVRNFEPALMELKENGGLELIVNCISSKSLRVFTKACFLLISISSENSVAKDEFAKMDAFNKLTKKLRVIEDYEVDVEIALNAMSILLESSYCNPPHGEEKEHVTDILKNIIIKIQKLPQCEEIVIYSHSILRGLENKTKVDYKS